MSTSSPAPSTLEDAIRHSGEGWLLDSIFPRENALIHVRMVLDEVNKRAQERQIANSVHITETTLLEEYRRNPQKVRGFFQALGGTRTAEMLLMVWRIMQGMEVKDVQISYRRQERFEMQVTLESPYGGEDAPYKSTKIHDFTLFRHIGVHEISGRPVFDGFYPLRVRERN